MRYLATILLLLSVAATTVATDLSDLDPLLPTDSYDVSTHAAYLRTIHLALRTFGMEEHSEAGKHMIPMGDYTTMSAITGVNGQLYYCTTAPARLYIYRTSMASWRPSVAYEIGASATPMYVEDYDPNDYGDRVEYAENLYDGTDTASATNVVAHLAMTDGTDNPHGLEADDIDFSTVVGDVDDLVTRAAGDGAALIPFPTGAKYVDDLVSTTAGDGASLVPFSASAHSLSGASSLYLIDTVDAGYDVTLLLDDLILDDGPWVDVRKFEVYGGGILDEATNIQTAVDSMTSGGVLYFPEGDYLIKEAIQIEEHDIWIVGAGRGKTTITRHDDVGTTYGVLAFNANAGVTYRNQGLANLTVSSAGMATTAIGISVGNTTFGSKVHFQNIGIDGDDYLSVGIDINYAVDSTFKNIDIIDCAMGIMIDDGAPALANRNLLFERVEIHDCTTEVAHEGAITMEWGNEISFRDVHIHENMGRAFCAYLTASTNTRAVTFDNCSFMENLEGSLTADYQVELTSAAHAAYTKWNFNGCNFKDAINGEVDNEHLHVTDEMQLSVTNSYFDDPGPEAANYKVSVNVDDGSRFYTDDYARAGVTMHSGAYVSGAGDGFTANGAGNTESLSHTLASGTPSDIDGVIGDKVFTTGALVGKGDPGGWVCTTSGSYDVLAGAACATDSDTTFTMAISEWAGHTVEIGERLLFAATTPWNVTAPTVLDVQVSGTTATLTMSTSATSTDPADTFEKQEPVWTPIAEIPIYHEEDDPDPGDIPAGVDAAGDLLGAGIVTGTFAVTGAAAGDFVTGSIDWADCTADADEAVITWWVGTAEVGYRIQNITAAIINLDGADFNVVVRKLGDTVP